MAAVRARYKIVVSLTLGGTERRGTIRIDKEAPSSLPTTLDEATVKVDVTDKNGNPVTLDKTVDELRPCVRTAYKGVTQQTLFVHTGAHRGKIVQAKTRSKRGSLFNVHELNSTACFKVAQWELCTVEE